MCFLKGKDELIIHLKDYIGTRIESPRISIRNLSEEDRERHALVNFPSVKPVWLKSEHPV